MASKRNMWPFTESGILRKREDEEELLVFGYSCKLFRDDEKALYIDQGKHLIPWMGDDALKIDRYDGRGALYDLKQYEAMSGGHDANRWVGLSDSERYVEQLCDEERYRALQHNEEEEALYQEEELKRLHRALDGGQTYGQVAFSYEEQVPQNEESEKVSGKIEEEEEEEPFVPPPELDVPVNMTLPDTVKLNAIIEKTALFISRQGAQMEILLKMKQANNPQFNFLSFDAPLHAYYRHLLMAIKTGRYRPVTQETQTQKDTEEVSDGHYLHPSLAPSGSRLELAPSIPSIAYKPSADCAYTLLVNKIRGKQAELGLTPEIVSSPPAAVSREESCSPKPVQEIVTPSPEMVLIIDKMASYVAKNGRDFEAIVKSKGDKRFTFLEPGHQFHVYYESKLAYFISLEEPPKASPKLTKPTSEVLSDSEPVKDENSQEHALNEPEDSDSDSETEDSCDSRSRHKPAPVCFSIKKPKDADILLEKRSALPVEESSEEEEEENTTESNKDEKKKQDKQDTEKKKSTESDRKKEVDRKKSEQDRRKPESDKKRQEIEKKRVESDRGKADRKKIDAKKIEIVKEKAEETVETRHDTEVIDLTEDGVDEKKNKWAEERLKDRLAAAAREKIAAAARERQIQMERKRRAAAFLNMIRKENTLPLPSVMGPLLPDGAPIQRLSGDEDDVSSIPSPTSSEETSPQRGSFQNGESKTLSLIQQSRKEMKRQLADASDCSDGEHKVAQGRSRHKHKRKKPSHSHRSESRHKRPDSSPHGHSRHRREEYMRNKKLKKKERVRSDFEHSRHSERHRERHKKRHKKTSSKRRSNSSSSA